LGNRDNVRGGEEGERETLRTRFARVRMGGIRKKFNQVKQLSAMEVKGRRRPLSQKRGLPNYILVSVCKKQSLRKKLPMIKRITETSSLKRGRKGFGPKKGKKNGSRSRREK